MSTQSRKKARGALAATKPPLPDAPEPQASMTVIPVDSLIPDAANVRRRDDRANKAIDASLAQFGPGRSILVGNKRIVRAGNGTLERFAAGGGTEVLLVRPKPGQLVAVERVDLSPTQEVAYAIADNRSSDLATNDEVELAAQLRALQSEDFDIEAAGFTDHEVDDLLARLGTEALGGSGGGGGAAGADPGPQVDKAADLQKKWKTKLGQLWEIPSLATQGECHRLLCGDSTNGDQVTKVMGGRRAGLMATDPPYLVDYQGGNHPRALSNSELVKDKHHADYKDALDPEMFATFLRVAIEHALDGTPAIYQWHAHKRQSAVEAAWVACGLLVHQQIIWVKNRAALTHSHYMWGHEPCFYGWIKGNLPARKPEASSTTVWQIGQQDLEAIHPTEKPLEIFTRPIQSHIKPGELCFEPFSGSGTCLAAAESTGRLCYAVEIAPAFVACALERLAGMGLAPRLAS
jgi:DNA modification methylase